MPILPSETEAGGVDELEPQQRLALAALVSGRSYTEAARHAGVCRKTLFNWRKGPAFARELDGLTREAVAVAGIRARNLMLRATRTLSDAMVGPDGPLWAIRTMNSKQVWAIARENVRDPDEASDGSVGASADA